MTTTNTERRYKFAYLDLSGEWVESLTYFKTAEDFRRVRKIDESRPVIQTHSFIDVPELTPEEIEKYEKYVKNRQKQNEIKKQEKLEKENEFENTVVHLLKDLNGRVKELEYEITV